MSNFRMRQRFLRLPPVEKPAVLTVVPDPPKPEPKRFPPPATEVRFQPEFLTRDACVVCSAQRDQWGRLPVGRCSPECPVVES